MGFEAFDPANMYQYSYAYSGGIGGTGAQMIYDTYDVGISIDYATDTFSIGCWLSSPLEARGGGFDTCILLLHWYWITSLLKRCFLISVHPILDAYEKSTPTGLSRQLGNSSYSEVKLQRM